MSKDHSGYISIHVVDLVRGTRADHIKVDVERATGEDRWELVNTVEAKPSGEATEPLVREREPGLYRLTLYVADYFATYMEPVLDPPYLPTAVVQANCDGSEEHHHIVVCLTPTSVMHTRGAI